VNDPIILARAVHIASTIIAAGTIFFIVLVMEPALAGARGASVVALRRRCDLMFIGALALAIVSGAAWLALLAADIYGAPLADVCLHGGLISVLANTRFGFIWSLRLTIALVLSISVLWPGLRWLQLATAAALVGLLALVGHAGATPGVLGNVHFISDVAHLIAAAAWLGSLPVLALLLAMARPPKGFATKAAIQFSKVGIVSVGVLAATGLINSGMLLGSARDLVTTTYGQLLALKIGLFLSMLGVAAVNKFYLTPRVKSWTSRRALLRNTLGETGLGLAVILVVSALGTMPPTAHHHLPTANVPADAAFTHIHSEEAMAEVTIEPGHVGIVNAHIRVMHEDSSGFATGKVRLVLDPPGLGAQAIDRAAVQQPDGTWQVNGLALPRSGNWMVRVIFPGDKGRQIVLDAPIVIEPNPR